MTTRTIKPNKPGQKPIKFQEGGLHASTGTPAGQKIPASKHAAAAAGKLGPKAKKQENFYRNVLHGADDGAAVTGEDNVDAPTGSLRAKLEKQRGGASKYDAIPKGAAKNPTTTAALLAGAFVPAGAMPSKAGVAKSVVSGEGNVGITDVVRKAGDATSALHNGVKGFGALLQGAKAAGERKAKGASSGALIASGFDTSAPQKSSNMASSIDTGPPPTPTTANTPTPTPAPTMPVAPAAPTPAPSSGGGGGMYTLNTARGRSGGGGGGGGGLMGIAAQKNDLFANNPYPTIYGSPEQQTAQARAWMQQKGYIDENGAPTGGKRSNLQARSAASGALVTAEPSGADPNGKSSNHLISQGLRGMAYGGYITSRGQPRGSKGINGKKLKRANGAMR